MAQLVLTKRDIEADIAAYQARIQTAKDKLASMHDSGSTFKERKKLKAERHKLRVEVKHVATMKTYATAALAELVTGNEPWMLKNRGLG